MIVLGIFMKMYGATLAWFLAVCNFFGVRRGEKGRTCTFYVIQVYDLTGILHLTW